MQVLICGAGHVAEAIVRCLLPIGVRVKWIDPRDDIFPSDLLEQAYCITTDTLDAEIEHFDRSGAVLILTHDHQLDLQLCFTALKPTAKPFAYVGMIGSKVKGHFEKRMQVRGYTSETLQRLVCPIGIDGISSKRPATIAVAVVAQLLQVFDVKNDPKGSFLFKFWIFSARLSSTRTAPVPPWFSGALTNAKTSRCWRSHPLT